MENSNQRNFLIQPQNAPIASSTPYSNCPIKTESSVSQQPTPPPRIIKSVSKITLDKLKRFSGITATLKQAIEKSKATKSIEPKAEILDPASDTDTSYNNASHNSSYIYADTPYADHPYNSSYEDTCYDPTYRPRSNHNNPLVVSYYLPTHKPEPPTQTDDKKKIQILSVKKLSTETEKIDLTKILDSSKSEQMPVTSMLPPIYTASEDIDYQNLPSFKRITYPATDPDDPDYDDEEDSQQPYIPVRLESSQANGYTMAFDQFTKRFKPKKMFQKIKQKQNLAKKPIFIENLDSNQIIQLEHQSPKHVHNYGTIETSNSVYGSPYYERINSHQWTQGRTIPAIRPTSTVTSCYDNEFLRPQLPARVPVATTPPMSMSTATEQSPEPTTTTYRIKMIRPDKNQRPLMQQQPENFNPTPEMVENEQPTPPSTQPARILNKTLIASSIDGPIVLKRIPKPNFELMRPTQEVFNGKFTVEEIARRALEKLQSSRVLKIEVKQQHATTTQDTVLSKHHFYDSNMHQRPPVRPIQVPQKPIVQLVHAPPIQRPYVRRPRFKEELTEEDFNHDFAGYEEAYILNCQKKTMVALKRLHKGINRLNGRYIRKNKKPKPAKVPVKEIEAVPVVKAVPAPTHQEITAQIKKKILKTYAKKLVPTSPAQLVDDSQVPIPIPIPLTPVKIEETASAQPKSFSPSILPPSSDVKDVAEKDVKVESPVSQPVTQPEQFVMYEITEVRETTSQQSDKQNMVQNDVKIETPEPQVNRVNTPPENEAQPSAVVTPAGPNIRKIMKINPALLQKSFGATNLQQTLSKLNQNLNANRTQLGQRAKKDSDGDTGSHKEEPKPDKIEQKTNAPTDATVDLTGQTARAIILQHANQQWNASVIPKEEKPNTIRILNRVDYMSRGSNNIHLDRLPELPAKLEATDELNHVASNAILTNPYTREQFRNRDSSNSEFSDADEDGRRSSQRRNSRLKIVDVQGNRESENVASPPVVLVNKSLTKITDSETSDDDGLRRSSRRRSSRGVLVEEVKEIIKTEKGEESEIQTISSEAEDDTGNTRRSRRISRKSSSMDITIIVPSGEKKTEVKGEEEVQTVDAPEISKTEAEVVVVKPVEAAKPPLLGARRRIMKIKPSVIAKITEGRKLQPAPKLVATSPEKKSSPVVTIPEVFVEPPVVPLRSPVKVMPIAEIKVEGSPSITSQSQEVSSSNFIWKKHRQIKESPLKSSEHIGIPNHNPIDGVFTSTVLSRSVPEQQEQPQTISKVTCDINLALNFENNNKEKMNEEENCDTEQMDQPNEYYDMADEDDNMSIEPTTYTQSVSDFNSPLTPQNSSSASSSLMNINSTPFQQLLETLKNVSKTDGNTGQKSTPSTSIPVASSTHEKTQSEAELLGVIKLLLQHVNPIALNETIIKNITVEHEQTEPNILSVENIDDGQNNDCNTLLNEYAKLSQDISVQFSAENEPTTVSAPKETDVAKVKTSESSGMTMKDEWFVVGSDEMQFDEAQFDEAHFDNASYNSPSDSETETTSKWVTELDTLWPAKQKMIEEIAHSVLEPVDVRTKKVIAKPIFQPYLDDKQSQDMSTGGALKPSQKFEIIQHEILPVIEKEKRKFEIINHAVIAKENTAMKDEFKDLNNRTFGRIFGNRTAHTASVSGIKALFSAVEQQPIEHTLLEPVEVIVDQPVKPLFKAKRLKAIPVAVQNLQKLTNKSSAVSLKGKNVLRLNSKASEIVKLAKKEAEANNQAAKTNGKDVVEQPKSPVIQIETVNLTMRQDDVEHESKESSEDTTKLIEPPENQTIQTELVVRQDDVQKTDGELMTEKSSDSTNVENQMKTNKPTVKNDEYQINETTLIKPTEPPAIRVIQTEIVKLAVNQEDAAKTYGEKQLPAAEGSSPTPSTLANVIAKSPEIRLSNSTNISTEQKDLQVVEEPNKTEELPDKSVVNATPEPNAVEPELMTAEELKVAVEKTVQSITGAKPVESKLEKLPISPKKITTTGKSIQYVRSSILKSIKLSFVPKKLEDLPHKELKRVEPKEIMTETQESEAQKEPEESVTTKESDSSTELIIRGINDRISQSIGSSSKAKKSPPEGVTKPRIQSEGKPSHSIEGQKEAVTLPSEQDHTKISEVKEKDELPAATDQHISSVKKCSPNDVSPETVKLIKPEDPIAQEPLESAEGAAEVESPKVTPTTKLTAQTNEQVPDEISLTKFSHSPEIPSSSVVLEETKKVDAKMRRSLRHTESSRENSPRKQSNEVEAEVIARENSPATTVTSSRENSPESLIKEAIQNEPVRTSRSLRSDASSREHSPDPKKMLPKKKSVASSREQSVDLLIKTTNEKAVKETTNAAPRTVRSLRSVDREHSTEMFSKEVDKESTRNVNVRLSRTLRSTEHSPEAFEDVKTVKKRRSLKSDTSSREHSSENSINESLKEDKPTKNGPVRTSRSLRFDTSNAEEVKAPSTVAAKRSVRSLRSVSSREQICSTESNVDAAQARIQAPKTSKIAPVRTSRSLKSDVSSKEHSPESSMKEESVVLPRDHSLVNVSARMSRSLRLTVSSREHSPEASSTPLAVKAIQVMPIKKRTSLRSTASSREQSLERLSDSKTMENVPKRTRKSVREQSPDTIALEAAEPKVKIVSIVCQRLSMEAINSIDDQFNKTLAVPVKSSSNVASREHSPDGSLNSFQTADGSSRAPSPEVTQPKIPSVEPAIAADDEFDRLIATIVSSNITGVEGISPKPAQILEIDDELNKLLATSQANANDVPIESTFTAAEEAQPKPAQISESVPVVKRRNSRRNSKLPVEVSVVSETKRINFVEDKLQVSEQDQSAIEPMPSPPTTIFVVKKKSAILRTKLKATAAKPVDSDKSANVSLGSDSKDSGDFEGFDASLVDKEDMLKRQQMAQEIQKILRFETSPASSESEHDIDTERNTSATKRKKLVKSDTSDDDQPLKPSLKITIKIPRDRPIDSANNNSSPKSSPPKIPKLIIKTSPGTKARKNSTLHDYFQIVTNNQTPASKRKHSQSPEPKEKKKRRTNTKAKGSEESSTIVSYTCSNCKAVIPKREWTQHYRFHSGAASREGIDEPIDHSNRSRVLNIMISYMKAHDLKELKCERCLVTKRSALGLMSHMDLCGYTLEEIESRKIECEYCKKRLSSTSMPTHVRSHCSVLKRMEQEKLWTEKEEKAENDEIELTDSGRIKRCARKKAEKKIKKVVDAQINAQIIEHIRTTKLGIVTAELRKNWYKQLVDHKIASCANAPRCAYNSKMITDLVDHFPVCEHKPPNYYSCTFPGCKDQQSDSYLTIVEHVRTVHKIGVNDDFDASGSEASMSAESEEDEGSSGVEEISEKSGNEGSDQGISLHELGQAKKKMRKIAKSAKSKAVVVAPTVPVAMNTSGGAPVLPCAELQRLVLNPAVYELKCQRLFFQEVVHKWTSDFRSKNYTNGLLYPQLQCNTDIQMLPEAAWDLYRPQINQSIRFASKEHRKYSLTNTSLKVVDWKRLNAMESLIDEGTATLFCGGPITAMDWATFPSNYTGPQVLAVSCKHPNHYSRLSDTSLSNCLIQIWKFENMTNKSKSVNPELFYSITCDNGPIQEMKFCPSGGYGEGIGRLGLLAVTTAAGYVNIYALPLAAHLNNSGGGAAPILNLIPATVLTLNIDRNCDIRTTHSGQKATCLNWTRDKHHSVIAAGFSNGLVAVWNLNCHSKLGKFQQNGVECLNPIHVLPAHQSAVTSVKFHHMYSTRYLMTCSLDRKVKVFDLESSFMPLEITSVVSKSRVLAADWNLNWAAFQIGIDESLAMERSGLFLKQPHDIGERMELMLYTESSVYDLCCNDWTNHCICVTESGDICSTASMQLLSNVNGKDVWNNRLIFGYTDVVRLNEVQPFSEVNEDYNDENGVVFCDLNSMQDCSMKAMNLKKVRSRSLIGYPFNRINRVRFNQNQNQFQYYAVGYQAGFVRIKKLSGRSR